MRITTPVLALILACVMPAHADTLLLNAIDSSRAANTKPLPSRGATMASVQSAFGEPTSTKAAVGEPPISRWTYPGYTVYFEHDRVINTVLHR